MKAKTLANRRYRLNRKVRNQGYRLTTKLKTIYVPFTDTNLPDSLFTLRDNYGYVIQIEIVD
jgi:hypothetical protein